MKRAPTRRLRDLLATTEAVRNDQRLRRRSPDRGEQDALADRLRHGERLGTEAERSGHSTAARIDRLERHAHLPEQRLFIGHLHERFVMTVAVEENGAGKPGRRIPRRVMLEKFAEQERLAP